MLIGTVAGVYVGMEYGMERIRGTKDWVILNSPFLWLEVVTKPFPTFFVWIQVGSSCLVQIQGGSSSNYKLIEACALSLWPPISQAYNQCSKKRFQYACGPGAHNA